MTIYEIEKLNYEDAKNLAVEEMKIKNLTQEVAGLKSQITKIKKSYKENEDGSIALSKSDINKLKQINKLIEGILQE